MSEQSSNGGTNGLSFIVGALVVVVAALGYFIFFGGVPSDDAEIKIDLTKDG